MLAKIEVNQLQMKESAEMQRTEMQRTETQMQRTEKKLLAALQSTAKA